MWKRTEFVKIPGWKRISMKFYIRKTAEHFSSFCHISHLRKRYCTSALGSCLKKLHRKTTRKRKKSYHIGNHKLNKLRRTYPKTCPPSTRWWPARVSNPCSRIPAVCTEENDPDYAENILRNAVLRIAAFIHKLYCTYLYAAFVIEKEKKAVSRAAFTEHLVFNISVLSGFWPRSAHPSFRLIN